MLNYVNDKKSPKKDKLKIMTDFDSNVFGEIEGSHSNYDKPKNSSRTTQNKNSPKAHKHPLEAIYGNENQI